MESTFKSIMDHDWERDRLSWLSQVTSRFTEMQLHQIKTGLGLIESLWRDFAVGTNFISYSQFVSVHKYLKEIGKDLFDGIFIKQNLQPHGQVFHGVCK